MSYNKVDIKYTYVILIRKLTNNKGAKMKNKDYPGIAKILEQNLKRNFFSFMTFKQVRELKDNSNIYQFPIQSFYKNNQRKKKG